jgi:hypothetical protein
MTTALLSMKTRTRSIRVVFHRRQSGAPGGSTSTPMSGRPRLIWVAASVAIMPSSSGHEVGRPVVVGAVGGAGEQRGFGGDLAEAETGPERPVVGEFAEETAAKGNRR